MQERLSAASIGDVPSSVARPRYDRSAVTAGIVHLGVGAFHRAHQAVYVDDCLANGELGWGIVGASLRSGDTRDALAPQDGLYTLAVRDGAAESLRIVGSLVGVCCAPDDPAHLLGLLCDPAIRIVTLTVTEKAYLRSADGGLDVDHPDIRHDFAEPGSPRSVHFYLVEAIARRRDAGIAPFTILCCDNLPANGLTVRRVVTDFARLRSPELAAFIEQNVAFPSSMVDRIVPATTGVDRQKVAASLGVEDAWPVVTEPFSQWVIEDNFPGGRPGWERHGVTMVTDVTPHEEMKLRLLNGAHSAIAYLGLLVGHATVDAAFADPAIRGFVEGLWNESAGTLMPDLDPDEYRRRLARRFSNTALAHQTRQIANDGSQKLPQRIVVPALLRLASGKPADHLALVIAAWIAACAARGRSIPAGHFADPLDGRLSAALAGTPSSRTVTEAVFALAGLAGGDAYARPLLDVTAAHLERLWGEGAASVLQHLGKKAP